MTFHKTAALFLILGIGQAFGDQKPNILFISIDDLRPQLAVFNDGKKQEVMLFDHQNDPNETKNIADQSPETLQQLMPRLRQPNKGYMPGLN